MKKSLFILATTTALAVSMISTSSFARGFGGFSGRGMERQSFGQGGQQFRQRSGSDSENQRLLRLASVLNLSDEQIAAIGAIQEVQKEPAEAIREGMKSARQSLRDLLQLGTYDEAEVAISAEVIGDLVAQRVILELKARFDISQVLTAEQNSQLEDLRKTVESHRRGKPEDTKTLL
jgi:Spy/CpxP family protein refolding chaperone